MKRRRLVAYLPVLLLTAGCPKPDAPPPPPADVPAITAPAPKTALPDLPPDPRALKGQSPTAGGGRVGTSKDTMGVVPHSPSTVGTTALPAAPVAGSALNKFFPNDQDGYNRIFTQEKKGFVLADLVKDKAKVAQLSINDTASRPETRDKFKTTSKSVGGYPAVAEGMNSGLSILVGDRYQVKIRATGGAMGQAEFEARLQKFDLAGLAGLK